MTAFLGPLAESFVQTALAAALLVGVTCSLLGVYVVHRRMAFAGDALAHATLPGVAAALVAGQNLALGALLAGLLAALLISRAGRRGRVGDDAAIGVVFTGMFALGVVVLSRAGTNRNLTEPLLGNVLAVRPSDLWALGAVTAGVAAALLLLHKELELSSYDPAHAAACGADPERLRRILLLMPAVAVVTAVRVVGVVLTTALLVTPAATARGARSVPRAMLGASAVAAGSALAGLLLSYHLRAPAGASIVLAASAAFAASAARREG